MPCEFLNPSQGKTAPWLELREFVPKNNICFYHVFPQTPEELEDVSDLEDDHDARSHTSIQTEGKTDRVGIRSVLKVA